MRRYQHSSSVLDGNPKLDGDGAFLGVHMMLAPDDLPAGVMASAVNATFEKGEAATRGGCVTMHWGNEADVSWATNPPTPLETYSDPSLYYFEYLLKGGPVWGTGRFNDPDGKDRLIIVRQDSLLACKQYEPPVKVSFPAGEGINGPCQVLPVGTRLMIRRDAVDGEPLIWDGSAGACVLMSSLTTAKPVGYTDLPAGVQAFYFKGRVLMLHARDQMARSLVLEFYYDPASADEVLNFGTADTLTGFYSLDRSNFLVFGEQSINGVYNFDGDLTGLRFEPLSLSFGTIAPGTIAGNGPLCLFLARDGVRTVQSVDAGLAVVSDKALSYPVQPLIDRIDWTLVRPNYETGAAGAQACVVGGRYYLAVPLKDEDGNEPSGNNAILVYNLETGQWEGHWESSGATDWDLVDLVPYEYYGQDRLYAIDRAGYVLLMEEGDVDIVGDTVSQIQLDVTLRGFNPTSPERQQAISLKLNTRTLNPTWSLWMRNHDSLTERALVTAKTYDRTRQLLRGRPRFALDNSNGDAMEPGREDYSVALDETGMYLTSAGVQLGRERAWEWSYPLRVRGAWCQPRLRNSTGRLVLTACRLEGRGGRRDHGRKL